MTTKNDGGPAFPVWDHHFIDKSPTDLKGGMSLRAYLAGQALPSIVAGNAELCKMGGKAATAGNVARDCLVIADALIAELEKETP